MHNYCTKKGPVIHVAHHVCTSLRHTKETQIAVPAIHRGLCTATYTEFFLNQAESTLGKRLIPAFHKLVETMMRVLHTCTVYDVTIVGDTPRTTGWFDACNNFFRTTACFGDNSSNTIAEYVSESKLLKSGTPLVQSQ